MIGRSIGNYKILEKISQNETVKIYRAVDFLLRRDVLIKILDENCLNQPAIVEEFRFEAATLAKLNHNGIPTLHSLTETDDALFMVMEFANGERLDKILQRRGKLSFDEIIPIFVQILDCLEYTHKYGVVHGNLETSSVVLTEIGVVKVLGYGTHAPLRVAESNEDFSAKRAIAGVADVTADIYALGAMFFEAVTGNTLNNFKYSFEVERNLLAETRKRLYSVNPFIPEEIKSAIIKALHPKPSERFQTASAFRDVLLANSFDELKINEEISVSEKLVADALPFIRLQPFELTEDFDNRIENSPEAVTTPESRNGSADRVYSSQDQSIDKEKKFKFRKFNKSEQSFARFTNSFVKKPIQSRLMIIGAGILAVSALHFIWQISLIQSEDLQIAEIPVKAEQLERKIFDNEPDYKTENENSVKPPKVVPPTEPPRAEIKPSRTFLKKKAPLETRAERLRRVERALTGV